jgi:hypothetical protein
LRLEISIAIAGCLVLATSHQAGALDAKDLEALKTSVHDVCVQPDRKGSYFAIQGDLSAGATLKIAGVNATGKITKEDWDGIDQRLDQYKTDPRACAVSIITILAPLMTPSPASR